MRFLVVDDDTNVCSSLKWLLTQEGHKVQTGSNGNAAVKLVQENEFDAAFMDVMMPELNGLDALKKILEIAPQLKVFMISGQADIEMAVKATKYGAYDFLEKPLNPERTLLEVRKLVEQTKAQKEINSLKKLADVDYRIVGDSLVIKNLLEIVHRAAPSEGRILIFGENGTGKELVAREIHKTSARADAPFVQLNCAAIPGELIESELFGYEKGAFTGAIRRKPGLIEQAEGGTLFLDEVGDMALETQAKLLRVLQENEFFRVGSTKPIKFNVRILAATNKDLSAEIKQGRFREDLYFRLNVIPVNVPPLRERLEDIPDLVSHFLQRYSIKNGKKLKKLSDKSIQMLQNYHWPGNVRELGNIIERLAIMTIGDNIMEQDVSLVLGGTGDNNENAFTSNSSFTSLKDQMDQVEKAILLKALKDCEGNISKVSSMLQTDRANLYKKFKKYGI